MRKSTLLLIALAPLASLARAATCTPFAATLCVAVDDYADVWINGHCMSVCAGSDFAYVDGTSASPVACISVPLTYLDPSGTNYIAVMVRNTSPTEMWGTWALDVSCVGGAHSYATSSDSFQFYHDATGTTPPPLEGGLPWYDPAYSPALPWGAPTTVSGSVYGKRVSDPQTGALLPPRSWDSSGSGVGADRMYFRQGFGLTPQPTPVPPNMSVQLTSSVCAMQNGVPFDITVHICNAGGNLTQSSQVLLTRDPEVSFCGPYSPTGYTISSSGNDTTITLPNFAGSSCQDIVICGEDYYIGPSEVGTIRHLTAALTYPGGSDNAGLDIPAVTCIVFTPTPSRSFTPSPMASNTFTVSPTVTVTATQAPPTATPSVTPSFSATPSFTPSGTPLPTATITLTLTPPPPPPSPTATPEPLLLTPKYPNPSPAKDKVWLPYVLSADADVNLRIFDISGELVLEMGSLFEQAGAHERQWDLHNQAGTSVASGIYLCHIVAKSKHDETDDAWVKVAVSR